MNTLTQQITGLLAIVLFYSGALLAADETPMTVPDQFSKLSTYQARNYEAKPYNFNVVRVGGFERRKLAGSLKIDGWKINNQLYIGKAKVANKWGLGLVYEQGNTVFGLNHRGIELSKRF